MRGRKIIPRRSQRGKGLSVGVVAAITPPDKFPELPRRIKEHFQWRLAQQQIGQIPGTKFRAGRLADPHGDWIRQRKIIQPVRAPKYPRSQRKVLDAAKDLQRDAEDRHREQPKKTNPQCSGATNSSP